MGYMEKLRKTIISDKIHTVLKHYTTSNCLPDKLQTHILLYWFSTAKHENKNFKLRWWSEGFVYSSFNNISNRPDSTASN